VQNNLHLSSSFHALSPCAHRFPTLIIYAQKKTLVFIFPCTQIAGEHERTSWQLWEQGSDQVVGEQEQNNFSCLVHVQGQFHIKEDERKRRSVVTEKLQSERSVLHYICLINGSAILRIIEAKIESNGTVNKTEKVLLQRRWGWEKGFQLVLRRCR